MKAPELTNFDGKTALITGATGGLGSLIAKRLSAQGARIALVDCREDLLAGLAEEINKAGGETTPVILFLASCYCRKPALDASV